FLIQVRLRLVALQNDELLILNDG
ncbi:uncharacterized protein METZ01_LOCUS140246, partial [marine metagenome]